MEVVHSSRFNLVLSPHHERRDSEVRICIVGTKDKMTWFGRIS